MCQRLIDCNFGSEETDFAMLTVALLSAMRREGRGDHPTEVVLMLAFSESGTIERSRNLLMRWRRGEISGHVLAREPGLSEQRDYKLGEIPMPIRSSSSAQPLFGSKRSRDGSASSHSVYSPFGSPPSKKVRMDEIELQAAKTSETLEKRDKDWEELCATFDEYKEKAMDRDEWKRKYDELQTAFKEQENKHLKELYNARASKLSPGALEMMSRDTTTMAKAQEFSRPSDLTAQQRMSSPSNTRKTKRDPSDTDLAPQLQEKFEQLARAAKQETHRARERAWLGSFLLIV